MREPDFPTRVGRHARHVDRREREAPRVAKQSPVHRTFAIEGSFEVGTPSLPAQIDLPAWQKVELGVPNYVEIPDGEEGWQALPTLSGLWLVTAWVGASIEITGES